MEEIFLKKSFYIPLVEAFANPQVYNSTYPMKNIPEAPGEGMGCLKTLDSLSEQLDCFIKSGECEMKIVAKHKRRFRDRTIERKSLRRKLRFWNFCVL